MFQIIILNLLLTLPILTLAQPPFPQIDGKCPAYTSKSGDYCVPKVDANGETSNYIVKSRNSCLNGYYNSGDWCRKGVGGAVCVANPVIPPPFTWPDSYRMQDNSNQPVTRAQLSCSRNSNQSLPSYCPPVSRL